MFSTIARPLDAAAEPRWARIISELKGRNVQNLPYFVQTMGPELSFDFDVGSIRTFDRTIVVKCDFPFGRTQCQEIQALVAEQDFELDISKFDWWGLDGVTDLDRRFNSVLLCAYGDLGGSDWTKYVWMFMRVVDYLRDWAKEY